MHLILLLSILLSCTTKKDIGAPEPTFRHGIFPGPLHSKPLKVKLDQAAKERGKLLYQSHCLSCHGEKGLGDGVNAPLQKLRPANLQKLAREVDNFSFFMSVSVWDGEMPGWKEPLTASEREDLVVYIKALAH